MNKEDILLIAKIALTFLTIVSVLFAIYYNYRKLKEREAITKLKEKLQKKVNK